MLDHFYGLVTEYLFISGKPFFSLASFVIHDSFGGSDLKSLPLKGSLG